MLQKWLWAFEWLYPCLEWRSRFSLWIVFWLESMLMRKCLLLLVFIPVCGTGLSPVFGGHSGALLNGLFHLQLVEGWIISVWLPCSFASVRDRPPNESQAIPTICPSMEYEISARKRRGRNWDGVGTAKLIPLPNPPPHSGSRPKVPNIKQQSLHPKPLQRILPDNPKKYWEKARTSLSQLPHPTITILHKSMNPPLIFVVQSIPWIVSGIPQNLHVGMPTHPQTLSMKEKQLRLMTWQ